VTSLRRGGSDSEGDNERAYLERSVPHSIERAADIAWRRLNSETREDHSLLTIRSR
jgi:hypothetical protein